MRGTACASPPHRSRGAPGGRGGRVVAGAVRVGRTVAAAIADRRVLEPVEANIALAAGLLLAALSALWLYFPRAIAYPAGVFSAWLAAALLFRAIVLYRGRRRHDRPGANSLPGGSAQPGGGRRALRSTPRAPRHDHE